MALVLDVLYVFFWFFVESPFTPLRRWFFHHQLVDQVGRPLRGAAPNQPRSVIESVDDSTGVFLDGQGGPRGRHTEHLATAVPPWYSVFMLY